MNIVYEKLEAILKRYNLRKLEGREIVSIAISKEAIKVVIFDNSEEKGISYAYAVQLQQGWLDDAAQIHAQLKDMKEKLQEEGYNLKNLCFIINMEGFSFELTLKFPILNQEDFLEALKWEVPQHIAWEENSYVYRYIKSDSAIVEKDEPTEQQEIQIYALPKNYLDNFIKIMQELDISLHCITVSEALKHAVNLDEIDFFEGFHSLDQLEQLRNFYGEAIKTALLYCNGEVKVNYLPEKLQRKSQLKLYESACKVFSSVSIGLSFVIALGVWASNFYIQGNIDKVTEKLKSKAHWELELKQSVKQQQELVRLEAVDRILSEKKLFWSQELKYIASRLPLGCWLIKLEQQDMQNEVNRVPVFILQGQAADAAMISQFIKALEESGRYHKVELLDAALSNNQPKTLSRITQFAVKITGPIKKMKGKQK